MLAPSPAAQPAVGWLFDLLPDQRSAELRVDPRSLAVYHEVTWRVDPTSTATVHATREVLDHGPGERLTARAVSTTGRVLATSVITTVCAAAASSAADQVGAARRVAPAPPVPRALQRHELITLTTDDVADFNAKLDDHYPIHRGPTDARSAGFRDLVVPGGVLVNAHAAVAPTAGRLAVWFFDPVIAGTSLELAQDAEDPDVWALVRIGDRKVVTVARRTDLRSHPEILADLDADA